MALANPYDTPAKRRAAGIPEAGPVAGAVEAPRAGLPGSASNWPAWMTVRVGACAASGEASAR